MFHGSPAGVVVERGGALIKATCMPGLREPETLAVKVMAKLVAEGTEQRSERGNLFPDSRPQPETDEHRSRIVVPEQLDRAALADSKRAGRKHSDRWLAHAVESRS